jgi:hypothetical protein
VEAEFGCPNPFDVELSPDMVQLGQRLSQEIANIQNSLQNRDLAESEASLLVGGADVDARLPAKTRASTPLPFMSRPPGAESKELQQDSSADSGKVLQNPQPRRNKAEQKKGD